MLLIEKWTDTVDQTQRLVLPDGSVVSLEIYYREQQQGWFIKNLSHDDFTVRGLRITNNVNLLMPWKNLISFGLACFTVNGREPALQQDFSSQASRLYLLTTDEVAQLDELLAESTT